ncbi:MAG TPA: GlsB/YeaQ/YmgE family stress response membrane protein [Gammaproteobacteria bacterium]|nr:GlsB/YeaQ/YmgE family stress response membrane protein [Gammaproteobacteria bacterium]
MVPDLIVYLAVGAVAGWLAGTLVKGGGFGLLGNIVVGVVGAFLGGVVFNFFGVGVAGLVGAVIMATVGAIILLFLIRLIKK